MRFSLTGVVLIMSGILTLAVFITESYRVETYHSGHSVALIVLKSKDYNGLRQTIEKGVHPVLDAITGQGVSFYRCYPASPWGPANLASILTGLYPSEHGLHRGHVYLSDEAQTLAERLSSCCFRSYASVGSDSLLDSTQVLQGIPFKDLGDSMETVPYFLSFFRNMAEYKNFFAIVEVDLDPLGGPRSLDSVLDVLYDGVGRDRFLENNILAIVAPGPDWVDSRARIEPFGAGMPVVLAGKTLQIAPGKLLLKPVSATELSGILHQLALGQGFPLRDGDRSGRIAAQEQVVDYQDLTAGEVTQPPPLFNRALWFDDSDSCFWAPASGDAAILGPTVGEQGIDEEQAQEMRRRYTDFLAARAPISDVLIPQTAGPLLHLELGEALGEAWCRPELLGHSLHGVEHFRLGEALLRTGYPALAVNELNAVLSVEKNFPHALFALAEAYASIDPQGAGPYYGDFLERYGSSPALAALTEKARQALLRCGE